MARLRTLLKRFRKLLRAGGSILAEEWRDVKDVLAHELRLAWLQAKVTYHRTRWAYHTARAAWLSRHDNIAYPLYTLHLLRYLYQRFVLRWIYLALSAVCVLVAVRFGFDNPFEAPLHAPWYVIARGSPVMMGSFLLIAGFLFHHFFALSNLEPPENMDI